jgi:hypothetical protein
VTGHRVRPGGRRRLEVAVHIVLLVAALFWLPFGTRDAGGVSNVLPALHPLPPIPAPAAEARTAVPTDLDVPLVVRQAVSRRHPAGRVVPALAVLTLAVALAAAALVPSRRRRSTPLLALGWHPHAPSRAPPVTV